MASPLVRTKLYVPQARREPGAARPAGRAAGQGRAAAADADLRARGIREDDAAGRLGRTPRRLRVARWRGCRWRRPSSEPGVVLDLRRHRPDTAAPGCGRRGAAAPPGAATRRWRRSSPRSSTSSSALAEGVDLVLDDYHLADGPERSPADVAFLLEHLPPQVHLVISTARRPGPAAGPTAGARRARRGPRRRPPVHRSTRWRRTSTSVVGLDLDAADVAALEGRTEGWIAALQLAALSLQGREDAAGFIAGFAGDDRYVVDYLVEEVLGRQPDDVRTFLLDTSILDRLSGPLCDAVTGGSDGKADARVARPLEPVRRPPRRQSPVVPLPPPLRRRPARASARGAARGRRRTCTARAAEWYAAAGEPVPAVRHALAAGDVEQAADLVERSIIGVLRRAGRRRRSGAGSTTSRTTWCGAVRSLPSASSGR